MPAMTLIIGIVSDRFREHKYSLLFGLFLIIISTTLFISSQILWILVIARVAQGASASITWVLGYAIISDTFPSNHLGFAVGVVAGCHNAGNLVGILNGGFLSDFYGHRIPYIYI
jgi:MFS family permease